MGGAAVICGKPCRWLWGLLCCALPSTAWGGEPFVIEVVEQQSQWPVPLVEMRTVSGLRLVTDNAGVIACEHPELMGRDVWFTVHGQGYGAQADGFGQEGVRLRPQPGGRARVEVQRRVVARRLGRLTGSGLFAESERAGEAALLPESGVVGCDSVQLAAHGDRLFWFWGDTTLAHYPLGIFHATGATSSTRLLQSFEPPIVPRLEYFRSARGEPRGVAHLSGRGPTWLSAVVSLPDRHGRAHLVATFAKIDPPLSVWQRGLCEWDAKTEQFVVKRVLWTKPDDAHSADAVPAFPDGHAAAWVDDAGQQWVLFGNPFPHLQMPASYEAWLDPETWRELQPPPALQDAEGQAVKPHSGSIAWNSYRGRWVTIFTQSFGEPSVFGEVWYAEAEQPTGPWGTPVKVLSHDNYTFYNPRVHAELTETTDPFLLFEGTYTVLFAAPTPGGISPAYPQATPRYEYNQMLYRLDLDDERLKAAQGGVPRDAANGDRP